jgi:peptidylprolyl isomerase/FKBP-type peptidyl-prolyl cis-trans isomerase FkpA
MKKSINIIIFVVLAVVVVGAGIWWNGKVSQESQNTIMAQGTAAEQAQSQIMQNLKIEDVVVGTGAEAKNGDTVTVNYTGTLDDGTKFDSSLNPGRTSFSFVLGAGQVIKGWDLGVLGMKVGGKRTLVIPPELGYGAAGYSSVIPPNATLHFAVELLSIATTSTTSTGQY